MGREKDKHKYNFRGQNEERKNATETEPWNDPLSEF